MRRATRVLVVRPASLVVRLPHGHVGPQPQIVGADLDDVADQLIAQNKEGTYVARECECCAGARRLG